MTCPQCLKPCEVHGQTYCGICHKHADECSYADCTELASKVFIRKEKGRIIERRHFCFEHGTDERFDFVRKGMEEVR